jgi:hypothetical protein
MTADEKVPVAEKLIDFPSLESISKLFPKFFALLAAVFAEIEIQS